MARRASPESSQPASYEYPRSFSGVYIPPPLLLAIGISDITIALSPYAQLCLHLPTPKISIRQAKHHVKQKQKQKQPQCQHNPCSRALKPKLKQIKHQYTKKVTLPSTRALRTIVMNCNSTLKARMSTKLAALISPGPHSPHLSHQVC